jgi:hypothetical protein
MSCAAVLGSRLEKNPALLLLVLFLIYAGIGLSGYGNDCDTYLMLNTGVTWFEKGIYSYSRPPGYLLPEVMISSAAILGGHALSNLLSAVLAALSLHFFWLLCRDFFSSRMALSMCALIGVNPYFVIASSSSMDYIYSIFFGLLGVVMLRKNLIFFAAIFFAFAISSRISNAVIVGIVYLYFIFDAFKASNFRATLRFLSSGAMALLFVALLLIPSFMAAGNSLQFFTYAIGEWGLLGYVSRFAYKNVELFGVAQLLAILTLIFLNFKNARFSRPPKKLIFGIAILLVQELLFLKVPLEVSYLLPVLFVIFPVIFYVFNFGTRAAYILALVTVVGGFVVNFDFINKKYNNDGTEAVGADFGFFVSTGVVVADILERKASQRRYLEGAHLLNKIQD